MTLVELFRSQGVSLEPRGDEYTGLCPFHHEMVPSLFVNEEKGVYYCFGCGAKGGIKDAMVAFGLTPQETRHHKANTIGNETVDFLTQRKTSYKTQEVEAETYIRNRARAVGVDGDKLIADNWAIPQDSHFSCLHGRFLDYMVRLFPVVSRWLQEPPFPIVFYPQIRYYGGVDNNTPGFIGLVNHNTRYPKYFHAQGVRKQEQIVLYGEKSIKDINSDIIVITEGAWDAIAAGISGGPQQVPAVAVLMPSSCMPLGKLITLIHKPTRIIVWFDNDPAGYHYTITAVRDLLRAQHSSVAMANSTIHVATYCHNGDPYDIIEMRGCSCMDWNHIPRWHQACSPSAVIRIIKELDDKYVKITAAMDASISLGINYQILMGENNIGYDGKIKQAPPYKVAAIPSGTNAMRVYAYSALKDILLRFPLDLKESKESIRNALHHSYPVIMGVNLRDILDAVIYLCDNNYTPTDNDLQILKQIEKKVSISRLVLRALSLAMEASDNPTPIIRLIYLLLNSH